MSLQNIINNATQITFNSRKTANSTVSRSGRLKTSLLVGNQPFVITVSYAPIADYSAVRGVLESIDNMDAVKSGDIEIGGTNAGLSWITEYQGDMSPAQLGQITATTTYSGRTLTLSVASVTGGSPSDYVFKSGDFFQLDGGYKYPYKVVDDVQLGSGSTITVTLNRPIISQSAYTINTGKGILTGGDVTWQVQMLEKPTFTVLPSRYVQFDGEFVLMEVIED